MEASADEEIKCFDDTAALIYNTFSSAVLPGLPKEPCDVDSKACFIKTEATSPVRDKTDFNQNSAGSQLKYEPSLKMCIKTEVTSPVREHVEGQEKESPLGLPKEPCEVDSKKWFVKTEPTSPVRDTLDVDENQGLKFEYEPSLKMCIKTEVTSPAREYVEERSMSPPGLPKEPCEVDSKEWLVKFVPASPLRDTSDVDENKAGLQLEYEPSLKMCIITEVTSPAREFVECSMSLPSLPKEPCEEDSKEWFIKTEATSPVRGISDIDQDPAGLQLKIERSLKMFIKTEVTSPQHAGEEEEKSLPGPAYRQITGDQCPYCPHIVQSQSDLEIHVDSFHKKQKTLHFEYNTRRKSDLKLHVDSINKKIKVFQCSLCDYKSNCDFNLQTHTLFAHKKKNYKNRCTYCKHYASSIYGLNAHIEAVHKKIKLFQCAHCNFKCSSKCSLKYHIDGVHNKMRPFKCRHCTNKYRAKSSLESHINSIHKKIKPFECPYCNFKTSRTYYINKHIDKQHINKRKFKCPLCNYQVIRLRTLKKHIHNVHKD